MRSTPHGLTPFAVAFVACAFLLATVCPINAQEWGVVDDDAWCDEGGSDRYCEIREITLAPEDLIGVSTTNGSVTIESWDRDEVYVKVRISVKGLSSKKARKKAAEIRLSTDPTDLRTLNRQGPKSWFRT